MRAGRRTSSRPAWAWTARPCASTPPPRLRPGWRRAAHRWTRLRVERLVGLLAARRPEPAMTVARSVADVLDDHVVFEVESIDRMYLNVWQPRLAYGGGVQGFFVGHRGHHYASTALMDPMTKAFVADIHGFIAARGLELVHFGKGQRKDDIAHEFLATFTDEEGVLFVGRA